MIRLSSRIIECPSISSLFNSVDSYSGISLFSSQTETDREYTGVNPVIILTEKELTIGESTRSVTDPLEQLDNLISQFSYLPDQISFLGYISYDFKDRLEEKGLYAKREQNLFPDFYFALYEHYIISRRDEVHGEVLTLNFPFEYKSVPIDLSQPFHLSDEEKICLYRGTSLDKRKFMDAVSKTVDYIKTGHIYQANITRAIYGETEMSPVQNALNLYHSNRISYGVFASIPGGHVTSTSPELFFKTEGGNIKASPIKGTVARRKDEKTDLKNREELLHSEKNIAELAMIVDLLRNDLSMVSIPGTVKVPEFPILMTLENVYHLYADVEGKLLPDLKIGDILHKIFPGGSITGCPKIRACQIIDELENVPRGIYTGSFGRVGFNGDSMFNIMIRSFFQRGNKILFNVGGGDHTPLGS